MKKITFLLLFSVFLMSSCQNSTPKEEVNNPEQITKEKPSAEPSIRADKSATISLNKGKKWTINKEMKPYLEKGEDLVNTYLTEEKENFEALAANLKTQNKGLTSSCTMKGKSHQELHKWLHPHLELTRALEKAKNNKEANQVIQKLEKSYIEFHTYFQ